MRIIHSDTTYPAAGVRESSHLAQMAVWFKAGSKEEMIE
jgi:hypothetical protein